jgi:hypothetical protein
MAALERANAAKGTLIERFRKANLLEFERDEAS